MKPIRYCILLVLLLTACAGPQPQYQKATVSDVRMTFVTVPGLKAEGGDAVAGAVVGGLITGGAGGAIVGAAIGDDSKQATPAHGALIACGFTATTEAGQHITFRLPTDGSSSMADDAARDCSLLRNGDSITLIDRTWWPGHYPVEGNR
jgi:hypothetical protein